MPVGPRPEEVAAYYRDNPPLHTEQTTDYVPQAPSVNGSKALQDARAAKAAGRKRRLAELAALLAAEPQQLMPDPPSRWKLGGRKRAGAAREHQTHLWAAEHAKWAHEVATLEARHAQEAAAEVATLIRLRDVFKVTAVNEEDLTLE